MDLGSLGLGRSQSARLLLESLLGSLLKVVPIKLEDGFYMTHDLAHVSCMGIESARLEDCIERITRDRIAGVFGHKGFGFTGDDLDFLHSMPWIEAVWFWDVKMRNVDGLYALAGLRHFGVSPARPAIDFSRFPQLRTAVVQPKARDSGLDACSHLKLLHVWRHPPKGREFSLAVPDGLEELGVFWSSLPSLDSLPELSRLKKLEVARCRSLETLGDLGAKFPSLERLVVSASGRVRDGEGKRVARDLPRLVHAHVQGQTIV